MMSFSSRMTKHNETLHKGDSIPADPRKKRMKADVGRVRKALAAKRADGADEAEVAPEAEAAPEAADLEKMQVEAEAEAPEPATAVLVPAAEPPEPAAASHGADGDESASREAVQIGEADGGGRGIGGWFGLS